ncbi:hypothetical protein F4679DRAFT_569137 [Xylaria curta]|nr:hypothetical protein F4679DRAFT_569137 [Xylaria curta]
MHLNLDHGAVCVRIIDSFIAATSLAVAGLSSAIAHFSKVLYDRARSDLINAVDAALDRSFMLTMTAVIACAVFTALASVTIAILGVLITLHPSWRRRHNISLWTLGAVQFVSAICIIATGAIIANDVYSVQTFIRKFGGNDSFPYFGIMYYGGVAQAVSAPAGEAARG